MSAPLAPKPRDIAALDVPAATVAAEVRKAAALALWNAGPDRFRELAEHPVHADAAHVAEYRHWLHDADPDSTIPPLRVDLSKHQPWRAS